MATPLWVGPRFSKATARAVLARLAMVKNCILVCGSCWKMLWCECVLELEVGVKKRGLGGGESRYLKGGVVCVESGT